MILVVLYQDDVPEGMSSIEAVAEVRYTKAEGLATAVSGADALLIWDFFFTSVEDIWQSCGSLKWIHVAAAGVEKLIFDELRASDVVITNSRGVFDRPIAEFVLASVLAFAKDLHGSMSRQEAVLWEPRETERIQGSRALIVGTGSIGRETARLLNAVGMRVSGVGRTDRDGDSDFEQVYSSSRLADVVSDVDYVVVIAPLTNSTRGMLNESVLSAMKPTARLINVGRGELIDEGALVSALRSQTIAGAALDVFTTEPLPAESSLWAMKNVLISPHMSGLAAGWQQPLATLLVENAKRYVAGEPLLNVVDKNLGFAV